MPNGNQIESEKDISFKSLFTPFTTMKAATFIIILGFFVFGNALFNQFVWDDVVLFYGGDTYRSIANIGEIFLDHSMSYYRPIPFALLAAFYTLFGETVFWYHFFQISLHIANTILLYILFKKFIPKNISFLLTLVFLVHPIQVESVSYIASTLNPLLLFFGLSALFIARTTRIKGFLKYCLISLLLLLAILTKETGLLFFIFIPIYMITVSQKKVRRKKWYLLGYTYFAALIPYIYLKFFITNIIEKLSTYTPIPIMNATLPERLSTFPKVAFYYIATFIFPKDLAISQQWLIEEITLQNFFLPLVVVVCFFAFFIAGIFLLKHSKEKRTVYLFFLFWFFATWIVHWNIIHPLDMTVADRWFYLPLIGMLGAIGVILSEIKLNNEYIKRIGIVSAIVIITLFSFRTIARNADWKDPLTLYLADSKISTESYDLETQLGEQLVNSGRYAEAKPHLEKAIQLAPDFWSNWTVLGSYYIKTKQIDKAIQAYSTSIKHNSGSNIAYIFLADTYFLNENSEETQLFLSKAMKTHPAEPYFIYLNGIIEYRQGNKEKGMNDVLRAYKMSNNKKYLAVYNLMQKGEQL